MKKERNIPIEYPSVLDMTQEEYETLPQRIKQRYYKTRKGLYNMFENFWHEQRAHGIDYDMPQSETYINYTLTGSEAGSIMVGTQLDPNPNYTHVFNSKSDVWYRKKGIEFPYKKGYSKAQEETFEGGHLFENLAKEALELLLQKKYPKDIFWVENNQHMYQCGITDTDGKLKYPFALANCDGDVYKNDELYAIAEYKNIRFSSPNYKIAREGGIPFEYYIQTCHYMFVRNIPRAIIIMILGNSYPDDFKVIEIERDEEVEKLLISKEVEFIESLENNIEPPTDGSDGQNFKSLYTLWLKKAGPTKKEEPFYEIKDEDLKNSVRECFFLQDQISDLKEEINKLGETIRVIQVTQIFPKTKEKVKIHVPYSEHGFYEVELKPSSKKVLKEDELMREKPDIYKECLVEKISVDKVKKLYPSIYEKYLGYGTTLPISTEMKIRRKIKCQ